MLLYHEILGRSNRGKSKRRNSSRNRYLKLPRNGSQQMRKLERSYTRIK